MIVRRYLNVSKQWESLCKLVAQSTATPSHAVCSQTGIQTETKKLLRSTFPTLQKEKKSAPKAIRNREDSPPLPKDTSQLKWNINDAYVTQWRTRRKKTPADLICGSYELCWTHNVGTVLKHNLLKWEVVEHCVDKLPWQLPSTADSEVLHINSYPEPLDRPCVCFVWREVERQVLSLSNNNDSSDLCQY